MQTSITAPVQTILVGITRPIETGISLRTLARVGKIAVAAIIAATFVSFVWLVLPGLNVTGPLAYGLGLLVYLATSASVAIPLPGLGALVVMSQDMNVVGLAVAWAGPVLEVLA